MISAKEAQLGIIDSLLPYFEHKRYELNSDRNQFFRSTNFGHSSTLFSVSAIGSSVYIEFFLGIRLHSVEEHLVQIFGSSQYYHAVSHTLITGWSNLWPKVLLKRYECTSERDIEAVAEIFIDFMDEKGFDFLHTYRKSANLCTLFNDHHKQAAIWSNYNYQHLFRALILAFLNNRSDRCDLYIRQREYLANRGFGQIILEKFDQVFQNLGATVIK